MGKEVKTKRGAVTTKVARETLIAQAYECARPIPCCHCGEDMEPGQPLRLCHVMPLELGGLDAYPNRLYGHEACEIEATKGDRQRIDKAKRQARETGPQKEGARKRGIAQRKDPWPPKGSRKLQSRGFRK